MSPLCAFGCLYAASGYPCKNRCIEHDYTPDEEDPVIQVKRLTPTAKLPTKATNGSAGFDLYLDDERIVLVPVFDNPGANYDRRVLASTGISIAIPEGYVGDIRPRSGLAAKDGVTVLNSPGTIDSDYRGEVKVLLINADGVNPRAFRRGDRIAQLVITKIHPDNEVVEVGDLPETDRGNGGFGSTGG